MNTSVETSWQVGQNQQDAEPLDPAAREVLRTIIDALVDRAREAKAHTQPE